MRELSAERVVVTGSRFPRWGKSALAGMLLGTIAILSVVPSFPVVHAQESPAATENAPAPQPPRRPRGRLPTYFARVVTAQQREQIYDLQAQYQEQLDELLEQVRKLEAQRDMEVFQVLTPEQQQQVNAWNEEARQRRAGGGTRPTVASPQEEAEN